MPKQIKIGFDRTISPKVDSLAPLYDVTGLPLKNENGDPIYTQEKSDLSNFYFSDKSLSVHNNNDEKDPIKVIEQFPETSQVSSSLLGIPRSEELLGLFSDVSTYGFNSNIWESFTFSSGASGPNEWIFRKNKNYGARRSVTVNEISDEQALALNAFPVSYGFPYGKEFENQGTYNPTLYPLYVNFFSLGRYFYDFYEPKNKAFADENFLPDVGYIDGNRNVIYRNDVYSYDEIFAEIEKWTVTWVKLKNGTLFDYNKQKIVFPESIGYTAENTRPGYSSNASYYGQITSKKAFRYQPGRISGFTFGLRCSLDQASLNNIIEWGCANATDQYVFQVRGPNFSIVRRSTVPLPEQNLLDMGLTSANQKEIYSSGGFGVTKYDPLTGLPEPPIRLYETVITRDYFNNDSLDGNGPSGYILNIENVTMYKIEFSWYGAIGAKFYAYIPVGNSEARWVLLHTLVIENKIGKPCLNDPYFKFKYSLSINDTANLISPQFVYKYGASYYIDGRDEGTSASYSVTSEPVLASPLYTKSLLGLTTKDAIKNRDGIKILNKKDVIPENISITTDKPVRVDVIDCEGCPGFGHHYSQSLHNGKNLTSTEANFTFSTNGKSITYTDGSEFTEQDIDKKLIGSGIYSTYIDSLTNQNKTAIIKRKLKVRNDPPTATTEDTYESTVGVIANGVETSVKGNSFNLRLSGYSSIAACDIALTKPNIEINFLNPFAKDGGSFADFYIGITNKTPTIRPLDGKLLFDNVEYDPQNVVKAEWSNLGVNQNIKGFEYIESYNRYGQAMEIDPAINSPQGVDSGKCSKLYVSVSEIKINCTTATQTPSGVSGNYLVFDQNSIFSTLTGLLDGEIGIESNGSYVNSGTKFAEDRASLLGNITPKYYIKVNNNGLAGKTQIIFRVVRLYSKYINTTKVFSFDVYPLYVVVGMRDYAKINNITVEEYDDINKFSYTPKWLVDSESSIEVVDSGAGSEGLNQTNGLFINGGFASETQPGTNFTEIDRLSAAYVDKQLQQPLRPGEIRTTFFLGENETKQFNLNYMFGQDRYVLTPGLFNTRATFFTAKALEDSSETEITLNYKEQ